MINYQRKSGTPGSRERMTGWTGRSYSYRELELLQTRKSGYALELAKDMARKDLAAAGYTLSKKDFELAWWLAGRFMTTTDPKAADLIRVIDEVRNGELVFTAGAPTQA